MPNIAYYELNDQGEEVLVQRPMTAAEARKHRAEQKAWAKHLAEREARPHPLIEQVAKMSAAERAELRTLLEG